MFFLSTSVTVHKEILLLHLQFSKMLRFQLMNISAPTGDQVEPFLRVFFIYKEWSHSMLLGFSKARSYMKETDRQWKEYVVWPVVLMI